MVCALEEKSCESYDSSSEQIEGSDILRRIQQVSRPWTFQDKLDIATISDVPNLQQREMLHQHLVPELLVSRSWTFQDKLDIATISDVPNLQQRETLPYQRTQRLGEKLYQHLEPKLLETLPYQRTQRLGEKLYQHLEPKLLEMLPLHIVPGLLEIQQLREIQHRSLKLLEIQHRSLKLLEITKRYQELPALSTTWIAFFLLVLLVLFQNDNVKNKYIKSCRKYNSLDSILYLLWQSGDIELNPGPATSIKYRQWLKDACVSVLKGIVGVHSNSKPRNVWKQPPNCWPSIDKPFFDPNNSNRKVKEIECLLDTLIRCWKQSNINIDPDIQQEIRLWERKRDDKDLLKKYNMRKIMKKVEMAINSLKMNSEDLEIEIEDKTCIIEIFFHSDDEQTQGLVLYKSEAIRRLTCLLFKIYNNKDPETKSDKIWVPTNKPVEWSKDVRLYNPNNGGKREKDGEDEELLGEVIKCIERKNIEEIYQKMISAWKTGDIESLSKLLIFYKATTDLKAAVKTMVAENLLDSMRQDIKRLGLSVSVKNVDKKRKYTEKSQRENKMQKQSTSQSCSPSCSSKDELLMIDNSEGDNTETDDWTTLKGINWNDEGIEDTDIDFLNDVFSF